MGNGLSMETLKNFLWPIVAIGGIGAFIDFLIGRTGQERAKDFLLRWWVRFDDVHWRNFGKEEGLFAGELIEKWFGRRIWSLRRYVVACLLLSLSLVIGYIRLSISTKDGIWCYFCLYAAGYEYGVYYGLSTFILVLMGFSLSVSFTRFLTFRMAYFCGAGGWKNLMMFCLMMLLNYIIFFGFRSYVHYGDKNNILEQHIFCVSRCSFSQKFIYWQLS
jgi:hypothetical protein